MLHRQVLTLLLPLAALASGGCQRLTYSPATWLSPGCVGLANELQVGRDCSATASACLGTPAPVCTGDYSPALPAICTLPCSSDAACGSGGACQRDAQSGLALCLPVACVPSGLRSVTGSGGPAETCPPTGPNAAGVGLPCTKSGGECSTTAAPFCTVDYAAVPAAFCTRTCAEDSTCGPGATCAGDASTSLRACVPNACLAAAETPDTPPGPPTAGTCPPGPNSVGVGKGCTRSGGQCTGATPYCSVDYISTPYAFCTKTCTDSGTCGSDATCQADPGGSGVRACIPNACLAEVSNPNSPPPPTCQGNAAGVGKTCTSRGGQCAGTAAALCTADALSALPGFCTRLCSSTRQCGAQAECVRSSDLAGLGVCVAQGCIGPSAL